MLDAQKWLELKTSYRALNLRMPCCGVPAVPKTSSRGTYFFAHARRGECVTADESPEHLYCKALIAAAAHEAGWTVTTERPGVSPGGDEWVADVFCEKGKARLALEVQMSPQQDEETLRRQLRYKESGVRGAWFFGPKARRGTTAFDGAIPAFTLEPIVFGEVPLVQQFQVGLPEFVKAMLTPKRLQWTVPKVSRPHLVEFIRDTCWACKKPVKQVLEHLSGGNSIRGEPLRPCDFYEGRWDEKPRTIPSLSNALEALQKVISNEELAAHGLNMVGRQDVINGKPTRFPFCNKCLHCGAPQNNFYLLKLIQAPLRASESPQFEDSFWALDDEKVDEEEERRRLDEELEDENALSGVTRIHREIDAPGHWVLAPLG